MKTLLSVLVGTLFLLIGEGSTPPESGDPVTSLTVNGLPLDSDSLSFKSQGVLAIVEGDLRWSRHTAIPYQALVAMGDSVQQPPNLHTEIWPSAWIRDEVVDLRPSNRRPVFFRVSLLRGGSVVKKWPASCSKGVYSLALAEVWLTAQLGDELVVEPLIGSAPQSVDVRGKRVLQLEKVNRPMPVGC